MKKKNSYKSKWNFDEFCNEDTTNRGKVKRFFVTFPNSCQSEGTKENFLDAFPPLEYYLACEEEHESGLKHLHALAIVKKKLTQAAMIKYLKATYPAVIDNIHVRPVRNLTDCINYQKGEDPYCFEKGKLKEPEFSKATQRLLDKCLEDGWLKPNWRETAAQYTKEKEQWNAAQAEGQRRAQQRREEWEWIQFGRTPLDNW